MRQGQITIFIVLGVVLFATFLLVFYFSASLSKAKLQPARDQAVDDLIRQSKLGAYVDSCLRRVTGNALLLLGMQGGYLYAPPVQNGTIVLEEVPTFPFGSIDVGYGVLFPPANPEYPVAPIYPLLNTPLFSGQLVHQQKPWLGLKWYFGEKSLPYLCDPEGPNQVSAEVRRDAPQPCDKGFYGENSIQEQLTVFIAHELKGCVALDDALVNLDARAGDPIVTVVLGESNLFVNASYPINVSVGDRVTQHASFQIFVPVRLRRIYSYLDNLLLSDVYYLNYTIAELHRSGKWDEQITVEHICPGCPEDQTELLTVTDHASFINSKPFAFTTAIQNRQPALDYLHRQSFPNTENFAVNYVEPVGGFVRLAPRAGDADEEDRPALTYRYSGWKEDYADAFLGFSCCLADPGAYRRCRETLFTSCMQQQLPPAPHQWNVARQPDHSASIMTELPRDIGFHTVRITVRDPAGLEDYQDVGIFVTPFPSDIADTGYLCGLSEGGQDPLACVCSEGAGGDAECNGLTFDQATDGECNGGAFCDSSCTKLDPHGSLEACNCLGLTFLTDGGDTACCGPTDCIKQNPPGDDRCFSRGSTDNTDETFLCNVGNNPIKCNSPRINCQKTIDGRTSHCSGSTSPPTWIPGVAPGAPAGSCP